MNVDSSFEKCRACLVDNGAQLFDWNALPDNFPDSQSYLQIFTECTRIDASPHDLPQKLCYGCASQLRVAALLIRRCRESDLLLRVKQEKLVAGSESEFVCVPPPASQYTEENQPAGVAVAQEYVEPMNIGGNEYFDVSGHSTQLTHAFFTPGHDNFPSEESESQYNSITVKEESRCQCHIDEATGATYTCDLCLSDTFPGTSNREKLKNNLAEEVLQKNLVDIIRQLHMCASLFLENEGKRSQPTVVQRKRPNVFKADLIINDQVLKEHLERKECGYIFREYSEKKTVSDSSRRKLVNETANLLRSLCSNYPTRNEKMCASKAITTLFPCFAGDDEGRSIFFDPVTNTGYLAAKLKNLNAKRKKLRPTTSPKPVETIVEQTLSDSDIDFFKNCTLPTQRSELEERLRRTVTARIKMCQPSVNIREIFPFFFNQPDLILFDFELRYPEKANKFFESWSQHATVVKHVFNESKQVFNESLTTVDVNIFEWNSEIQPFLLLLKLLPAFGSKPKNIVRPSFQDGVNDLIRFENLTKPDEELNTMGTTPFIIARGHSKLAIYQYAVVIDSKIIQLPPALGLYNAFDLLFKTFFVCNIEFNQSLHNFFSFFCKYIYNFENTKVTARCDEIFLKLRKKIRDDSLPKVFDA